MFARGGCTSQSRFGGSIHRTTIFCKPAAMAPIVQLSVRDLLCARTLVRSGSYVSGRTRLGHAGSTLLRASAEEVKN